MDQQSWRAEADEMWAFFKENREQLEQNRIQLELLREQSQETKELLKDESLKTERMIQDNIKQMNRLDGRFGNQWGMFIENMVKPNAVRLFQQRGIGINRVYHRIEGEKDGIPLEIDLLLVDSNEIVVIEVKSRVSQQDVKDLLTDLDNFPMFFPEYRDYQVYGAIAGLDIPAETGRWAYRQGLFVLALTGEGLVTVKNDAQFRPKSFGVT